MGAIKRGEDQRYAHDRTDGRTPELNLHIFRYLSHHQYRCHLNRRQASDSRNTASINDPILLHLLPTLGRLFLVDPVWLKPMIMWDLTEFDDAGYDVGYTVLEFMGEWFFVEEYVGVVVFVVEAVFDVADAADCAVDVGVAG